MQKFRLFQRRNNEKRRQDQRASKCFQCLRPIDGHIWKLDGQTYCEECYNRKMAIIRQTEGQPSNPLSAKEIPSKNTFVCTKCKRKLATKYLHECGICADCFISTNSQVAPAVERSHKIDSPFLGEEYKLDLPKKLFRWSDRSIDLPGDNVYQHWEDVILCEDGRLIIEENSITYSAHSIGHNTGRDTTTKPLSFDQLPKMIALAEDKNAQKYLGMNEQNWPKYVRVRKTNEELASELETVVTLDLDYSNWVELRLHKTTGRAYIVNGENIQHGGATVSSITSIKRAVLSEVSSMVAKEYDYAKAFKLLYPKWEEHLCRKVLVISDSRYRIGWFAVVDGVEMPREAILFGETVFQVPAQFLTEDQHKKYAAYHTQTGPYEHYFDLPAECCEKVIRKLVPLESEKEN